MKNKNLTFLKIAIVAVLGVATVISCKKDTPLIKKVINASKDEQLYNTIIKSGVKAENIKDVGEYYLVEGDMLFKKNRTDLKKVSAYFGKGNENIDLIQMQQNNAGKGKIASANIPNKISQWQSPNSVSSWNVERVYIQNTTNLDYTVINASFGNWANISDCKINFYGLGARGVPNENSIKVITNMQVLVFLIPMNLIIKFWLIQIFLTH